VEDRELAEPAARQHGVLSGRQLLERGPQPEWTSSAWRDFRMLVDELGHRPPASPYIGQNIEESLH
jgi:hypothetical protein